MPGAPLSEGGRRGTREGRGWAGAQRRGRPPGPPPVGAAARAREREVRLRAPFRLLCRADVGRGRRKLLGQPTLTAGPSFARDREREGPCWHAHSRSLPVSFSPQSCQADLVKDNGHKYFLSVLADPYMPVRLRPLPGHPRGPCRLSRRRVMLWGGRGRGCSLRAGRGGHVGAGAGGVHLMSEPLPWCVRVGETRSLAWLFPLLCPPGASSQHSRSRSPSHPVSRVRLMSRCDSSCAS